MLFCAAPSYGQERGTVEFGAFGSLGRFDQALSLDKGYGGGGRVGVFMDPRIALEFEKAEMRASRPLGLRDVNVGILSSRAVFTAVRSGAMSLHVGAGAGASTETNFLHSYGVNGMIGAKFAVNDRASFRLDGISHWLANEKWKSYQTVHLGLSLFRRPNSTERIVQVQSAPAAYVQRPDSVSAEEQARRRRAEQDYRMLRDSLNRAPAPVAAPVSSTSARATMEEHIHFASDMSTLSAEARAILDAKVLVFRANPGMRIVITGHTDQRASDSYNMSLGSRRAAAAKAYIVSQGIDGSRVLIETDGERTPAAAGTSQGAEAMNRRDEFRLLIGGEHLVSPK